MVNRGIRHAAAAVGVACIVTSIVGCTAPRSAPPPPSLSAPGSVDAASSSFADQFPYLPTSGATLATATLLGTATCPGGPVRIVVNAALNLEVRVPAATTTAATYFLSTSRTGSGAGLPESIVGDEQLGVGIGQEALSDPDGETVFPLRRELRADRGDLTYFHSIRCKAPGAELVEQAPLTWTQPPFFRSIHPVDSGSRLHARGRAVLEGSVVSRYDIAADDTLDAIARRFGVRPVELLYINPSLGYTAPRLLTGDALNLDPRIR